ncbi:MAG: mechanosensitive ion channel, partial [Candidatus Sumerlaeaceae bacterium]|nr:mechanosensitive ion channel [Candidatus Sumerlaeaceae bacterium]
GGAAAVTVGDVLVALVFSFMTVILMRNVSGLLEVLLSRWTRVEQGTRYAISAVVRYSIAIAGLMAISKSLGITWKSVQWMAAAVTVGLGFGLQEIFANFVSGLILLFERPVRVGDWITVSGTTGIVTHIRTRATTVRDADGKELLIPNRLLITSPVMNWTLSDNGIRLAFDVRVSPDADEKEIRQALVDAACRVTQVSRRPEPTVMLDAMTNTEQRYRLFVFTNHVELRYEIKDNVITAIRENLLSKPYQVLAVECAMT